MDLLPELMELRKEPNYPPQLLLLGAEKLGGKLYAHGYITLGNELQSGEEFIWDNCRIRLKESLPGKKAAIIPLHFKNPMELEIIEWPEQTKS